MWLCPAALSQLARVLIQTATMFNAPRPAQRYVATSASSFGGSFVNENPLTASGYDGLDPWSAAPSPSPTPIPAAASVFGAVIGAFTHQGYRRFSLTNSLQPMPQCLPYSTKLLLR